MRVPLWREDLAPRTRELVAAIEERRGGALLNLDRMLLWSEPLARGWNGYLRAIRTELSLSPLLRELAICVVARLTGADYEYHHHAPELKKAGASDEQLADLDERDAAAVSPHYDDLQRAVMLVHGETAAAAMANVARALASASIVPIELLARKRH